MNPNEEFLEFIIDQTDEKIHARKMFSSLGLYLDDIFFGIINEGVLYLKTNKETSKKFKDLGSEPFTPSKEQILKNYMEVPGEIIENGEILKDWVLESIQT